MDPCDGAEPGRADSWDRDLPDSGHIRPTCDEAWEQINGRRRVMRTYHPPQLVASLETSRKRRRASQRAREPLPCCERSLAFIGTVTVVEQKGVHEPTLAPIVAPDIGGSP